MPTNTLFPVSFFAAALLVSTPAAAQQDTGPADAEIRIGNIMPYTGAMAAFATIGKAEAAFFEMVNERGGMNGRKIKFISVDDSSNSREAAEQTRHLVERENVLLMFGSFGTPGNLAARQYLNERKVPQLFVASGDEEWAHPKSFPWTMGWNRRSGPKDASLQITSRSPIPTGRSPCSGKTISSD